MPSLVYFVERSSKKRKPLLISVQTPQQSLSPEALSMYCLLHYSNKGGSTILYYTVAI